MLHGIAKDNHRQKKQEVAQQLKAVVAPSKPHDHLAEGGLEIVSWHLCGLGVYGIGIGVGLRGMGVCGASVGIGVAVNHF